MRITLVFLFILLTLCLPASAENMVNMPVLITIKNFGKVDNCYYRAGQIKDSEFQQVAALGVRTIVNLRYLFSFSKGGMLRQKAIANSLGMNYINIPMLPTRYPSFEQIKCYFDILNNSANLPVLVYDKEGKDRMGLMAALYRVKYCHWTYEQAYSEMKSYGYHSVLFPKLAHFLQDYAVANRDEPCVVTQK